MPTIQESIKVFNELRNGSDFLTLPGSFTTVVKANAGEKIKIVSKFRVFWELIANAVTNDNLTVAAVAGGHSLTSANQNFEDEGFRIGDVFTPITVTGPVAGTFPGQIITLISGNYVEFTLVGGLLPGVYTDAVIKGTTDLDTLDYNFNFPASSNSQNLVSDIFRLIPSFKFTGLVILGADIPGVAKTPIYWNGGSSIARKLSTVNTYEQVFEVETIIEIPEYKEGEFNNLNEKSAPLPYTIETKFFKESIELANVSNLATIRPFDIERSINDSIGWLNESFDSGPRDYSLVSVAYEELASGDERETIEVTESTKITVVIASNNVTFLTNNPLVLSFRNLFPETVYNSGVDDFDTTNNKETIRGLIDGGPVSNSIINDFTTVLDGPNQITMTAVFTFDQAQKDRQNNDSQYFISIDLEDSTKPVEESNRLNLIIDTSSVTKNSDIDGIFSMTTDEIYYQKDEFIKGVSVGNTDLNAWNESLFMRNIEFDIITEAENAAIIVDMSALIIAYNNVEEVYFVIQKVNIPLGVTIFKKYPVDIAVQQISTDETRGFLIPDDSQFNNLKATTDVFSSPNQAYSVQVGIMVDWQYWKQLLNADTVFYNVTQPNNGLNKKTSNYSDINDYDIRLAFLCNIKKNDSKGFPVVTPYLNIGPESFIFDFDLDKNVTPKYITTYEYRDKNGFLLTENSIRNEVVELTAIFDSSIVESVTNFEAVVRLEEKELGTEKSKELILTNEDPLPNRVLLPLDGETRLKKLILSGEYVVQCLIDGSKLPNKSYSISAEIQETLALNCYTLFNGINQRNEFGNDASLQFDRFNTFTISTWFMVTSIGGFQAIFGKDGAGFAGANTGYFATVDPSGRVVVQLRNTGSVRVKAESTTIVAINTWYNLVQVWRGTSLLSGLDIYIDKVKETLINTQDTLTSTILNNSDFVVADFTSIGTSSPFGGCISHTLITSDAKNQSQVDAIYDETRISPDYSAVTNKVSHWKMEALNPVDQVSSNDGTSINTPTIICE